MRMRKGIDISTWQQNVDYSKLKEQGIEFAIIRCGFGKDSGQKDNMFEKHYKGLKENGIAIRLLSLFLLYKYTKC